MEVKIIENKKEDLPTILEFYADKDIEDGNVLFLSKA